MAPSLTKEGEGPDKNMDAPSAILSCKVGLRTNRAPPLWVRRLRLMRLRLVLGILVSVSICSVERCTTDRILYP